MNNKEEVPTITVDLDRPCRKCGEDGALPSGLCLKCTTKAMENDHDLIYKAVANAATQISNLLQSHATDIQLAYIKRTEEKVSVGLSVDLQPSNEKPDTIVVTAKINFISGRIKDATRDQVSNQQKLPLDA